MSEFNDEPTLVPAVIPEPTQIQYPFKAVLRTVVAFVLGALAKFGINNIPGFGEVWMQYSQLIVDVVNNFLFAALVGFFTWLFTLPKVNAFLTKIGLGAQPKRAVVVVE